MSSPSGRGTPLRAGSPRCCNERRPGSGSPHPPRRGGSPIRPSLLHPLHLEEQRVPRNRLGFPLFLGLVAGQPQTARVITRCNLKSNGYPAHHPPLPGTINPVCATREHVRLPGHHMPALVCAMREHGGLAWPPRLSARRQPGWGKPTQIPQESILIPSRLPSSPATVVFSAGAGQEVETSHGSLSTR